MRESPDLEAANAKLATQAKANAETAVAAAVKDGKLKDDATIRAKWVEAFVRDFDGTKAMIDGLEVKPATRGTAPVVTASTVNADANKDAKAAVDPLQRVAAAFGAKN